MNLLKDLDDIRHRIYCIPSQDLYPFIETQTLRKTKYCLQNSTKISILLLYHRSTEFSKIVNFLEILSKNNYRNKTSSEYWLPLAEWGYLLDSIAMDPGSCLLSPDTVCAEQYVSTLKAPGFVFLLREQITTLNYPVNLSSLEEISWNETLKSLRKTFKANKKSFPRKLRKNIFLKQKNEHLRLPSVSSNFLELYVSISWILMMIPWLWDPL